MRVVLDTNILISALISKTGPPGRLLSAVKRAELVLVTSVYQLDELREALGRERLKPYIRPEEVHDLFYNLEAVGVLVTELPEVKLSPDPDDNPILATALAGNADLIISGDKAGMLDLQHVNDIPIITPARAMEWLNIETRNEP